jgi:hypothetical protein
MMMGLLFLIGAGAGAWSIDAWLLVEGTGRGLNGRGLTASLETGVRPESGQRP